MTAASVSAADLASRWDALVEGLTTYGDLLRARAVDELTPQAFEARGWCEPLLSLTEDELIDLEIAGVEAVPPPRWPEALRALHADARALTDVAALTNLSAPSRPLRRLESPRKRAQVEALGRLAAPLVARATRVVEVGAGHGHLAREIAAAADRPVVAFERDQTLAARARDLEDHDRLTFEDVDVLERGLALRVGDAVLGLHACGELGDAIARDAAASAESVLLVGCCLQKQRADVREPLSAARPGAPDARFEKALLGLSNFTPRAQGVEASRAENVAARERRLALHALLERAVGPLRFGAEMDGLNRRAAHGTLAAMASRAFARRGLAVPSDGDLERAAVDARRLSDRLRRLSLPRTLLGRVLETFVLVDRALYLASAGLEVSIGTAFPKEVSARNLTLIATRA